MKKKMLVSTIILLWITCVSWAIIQVQTIDGGICFTDNIENYNSNEFPVPQTIFPAEIPANAHVVSFSYFNYWHEAEDIYLELKFNTLEEMKLYLSDVKRACASHCQHSSSTKSNSCFIETQNIYNQSYEDMFSMLYCTSQGDNHYTGYTIRKTDSVIMRYECNFGVITYSFDELTVIHSYVYGWYRSSIHNHIPAYFKRFGVPLQENHQRIFYLEW